MVDHWRKHLTLLGREGMKGTPEHGGGLMLQEYTVEETATSGTLQEGVGDATTPGKERKREQETEGAIASHSCTL